MELFLKQRFLISIFLLALSLHASPTTCQGIYFNNIAPDIENPKYAQHTTEICYSQFALMHSGISKTALWSAEHLTRKMLQVKAKREDDFHPDEHLKADERAELSDYAHSGYDRGHLSPSGDFEKKESNQECFTLANMLPQNHENNSGIWADIENTTRYLARKQGSIYVVTGPIFPNNRPHKIANRVYIPSKIFKAIYLPSTGEGAAYITNNSADSSYSVISIAELEKLSGIDVFPQMSKAAKEHAFRLPTPQSSYHGQSARQTHQAYYHTDNADENGILAKLNRKVKNYFKGY